MSRESPVVIKQSHTFEVTADLIGLHLANDDAISQGEMLVAWLRHVDAMTSRGGSWPMQCRYIAEGMGPDNCGFVLSMLETLTDHLRAIPREAAEQHNQAPAEPTEEGKRRFEPDGRYSANEQPGTPCTCTANCPNPCKGACGCEACSEAYGDYMSSRDD